MDKEYFKEYRRKNKDKISKIEKEREKKPERIRYKKNWLKIHKPWLKLERKNKVRIYVKSLYRKRKEELIVFMGGKCVKCGLTPKDVRGCLGAFVIDEIIPLGIGKRKFASLSVRRLENAKILFKEIKIQLLCQNCSAIKTWEC